MTTKYHINPETGRANICHADPNNPRSTGCDFKDANGVEPPHYASKDEAKTAYEKIGTAEFGTTATFSKKHSEKTLTNVATPSEQEKLTEQKITLESSLGTTEVINGDLSNENARAAFTTGLCGDLAVAIHEINGADIYFVCDKDLSQEEFDADMNEEPEYIYDLATHAIVGSTTPGKYLDADGQQTTQSIEKFYKEIGQDIHILKGKPEHARLFAGSNNPSQFSKFAETAIEMDKNGESYLKVPIWE